MINEFWLETYDKISTPEKAQLRRCINGLLAHTFLLSEVYDDASGLMKGSSDFRLVDRFFDWLHDYFAIAGWDLVKDRNLGVIYLETAHDYNRMQLDSLSTLILLTLRLLYDEEREKLTLHKSIPFEMHQVVSRLLDFNTLKRKPADRDLVDAFRTLSRFNIVQRLSGSWQESDCRFLVQPSICLVISGDAISRIYQSLQGLDGFDGIGLDGTDRPGAGARGAEQLELDGLESDASLEEEDAP